MKNKYPVFPVLLWTFLQLTTVLHAQTFTDIPGPMGTVRAIQKGANGEWYIGSSTKGVFRSTNDGQTWSGLGGNTIMTGRINDFEYDTSGQLMVATEQGGIKTWNGTAWISLNNGLFTACGIPIPIRALAADPQGHYFAGAHGYSACFSTGDLYRFDGTTWNSIGAGLGNTNVNTLALHPETGVLYAGTDGGVFRYEGASWTPLNTGLGDSVVHKIVFAPNSDLFAGTNAGIFKLPAGANTWVNLSAGLNGDPVHSFAYDDQNPDHLLIGTGYSIEQTGPLYGALYESQNGGQTWTQRAPGMETLLINDLAFTGNQTCLAAGWGVFRSADNGQQWAASNSGFSARAFNTQGRLAVSPPPARALFYGSDDGLFRSLDNGLTWTMASRGLTRRMVTLLKADRAGNLFCGVMRYMGENSVGFGDGLLYKSTDNGDHWLSVAISKDWRYMEMSELSNGDLICAHGFGAQPPSATITGSSLALSTDHGDTWVDLDVSSGMAFCCAASPAGDLFVAGESQSVYRSTDGGSTFELIVAPGQAGNVGTLEVSPTGDVLMGSGGIRTLFFSTDNGVTYETFSSPVLPDYRGVSDVTFDHLGKAYCTTSGQGGSPALFTISSPFTANSTFTPVAGLAGSLFKMTWDACGYLYVYRAGGILKSTEPLRPAEDACVSALVTPRAPEHRITVSPNPAKEVLYLNSDDPLPVRVTLWNWMGQQVREAVVAGAAALEVSGLPPGIYMLKTNHPNDPPVSVVKE